MNERESGRLSIKGRFAFASHGFGYNFLYYWISAFMAIFCTDVLGIGAGVVSALTLGCRIFDVVNDPIIGSMADRSKLDKKGNRYTKWIRWASIGLSALIFLLFATRPNWSMGLKVTWICVLYVLITVFSTAVDMPYGALNGLITTNSYDRAKASSWRMVASSVGSNLCGALAVGMIAMFSFNGNTANGYMVAVGIAALVHLVLAQYMAANTQEVVHPVKEESIPMKAQLQSFFKNKYIIIAVTSMFFTGFNAYSAFTLLTYFFTYYAGNTALISVYSMVTMVAGFVGAGIVSTFLLKRLKGSKGNTVRVAAAIYAIVYIILYFVAPSNPLFFVLIFIAQVFTNVQGTTVYSLVGDAADYGEYISGYRTDGFQYSFASLMLKFGGAVGPSLLLALLGKFGYVANGVQNETVLNLMHYSISFLPAIVGILAFILYSFYDLSADKHAEIQEELAKRRQA